VTAAAIGGDGKFDRRQFLRLAALGAGALTAGSFLEACAKAAFPVPTPFHETTLAVARRSKPGLQLFPGGQQFLAGRAQRFSFGLTDPAGTPILGPQASVWIGKGNGARGPYAGTLETFRRIEQPGDPTGFYVTSLPMPAAGIAWIMAEARGLYGFAPIQVLRAPVTPDVGRRAIPVATPTAGHPRGVAAICTRKPPCPMHTIRLDEALRADKPVVFTLASPLLCTSRTCGPVVDEVLDVRAHAGSRATFIHAEPYKGDAATALSPTALAWKIPSEPWTWIIDRGGVVRAAFEGPVVATEIERALVTAV
jgi:hypothetical protein